MGTTTTPEPQPEQLLAWASAEAKLEFERRHAKIALSSRYGKYADTDSIQAPIDEPATGRDDDPRLILSTDQLLHEILRRPGQLFVVITLPYKDRINGSFTRAWIEFADGSKIEVQSA